MRFSKQREIILSEIKGTTSHPDAEWVYRKVKDKLPNISLGTVYRNLKLLSLEKKLLTLETEKNALHYDGDTSNHSHFICRKCDKILDIFSTRANCSEIEKIGCVENEKTVYYGVCKDCLNDNSN